jgi:tetratricopeptide (TPR) repeat protein
MSDGFTCGGGLELPQGLAFDVAILESVALGVSQRASLWYRFGAYRTQREASLALEQLVRARAALERRDYLDADQGLQAAVRSDPEVGSIPLIGGGRWKRKAARLRELLAALDLESRPDDLEDLRQPTVPAELAQRAIASLLNGDLADAVLLAQVASGENRQTPVFQRLPQAMSLAARRPVVPADTLSVAAFTLDRQRQNNAALAQRRFTAAIEACRQMALVMPENELAWQRLGWAYLAAGRRRQARAAYDKALALDPHDQTLRDLIQEHFHSVPSGAPSSLLPPAFGGETRP